MALTAEPARSNFAPCYSAAVTPSDSVPLATPARALYIGVSGDVKVTMLDGSTPTFKSVPVGKLEIQVTSVFATGTTATNIIALW